MVNMLEGIAASPRVHGTEGRIFEEHRTIGYVSNAVPCFLRYIHNRKQNFVVTCTGKSFNTYASQQLKLISVGGVGFGFGDINCMTGDTYHVYTGMGKVIYAWRRGTELKHTYKGHQSDVKLLLAYAQNLLSIDEDGNMKSWNIKSEEIVQTMQFKIGGFNPTVMMHPLTYENKIIIGSAQGMIQLWNIGTGQLIHHFSHWPGKRINDIVQAPGMGVIAIAISNKTIALLNIQYDVILMTLDCIDEPTRIAFRTDGIPTMMAGSSVGSITVWDLEKKDIISYENEAHHKAVTGLVSFLDEPIMISSSVDNSVKAWIFDKPDGGARLLTCRDGHELPPSMIGFHGDKELNIITAGEDKCLRSFHIYNETVNRKISNYVAGNDNLRTKGVPVTHFAIGGSNSYGGWENIACFDSSNGIEVNTFSVENAKRGADLKFEVRSKLKVTSLCLTSCTQFAIVGFKTGELYVFNMQSKMRRKIYSDSGNAHRKEVTGVAVDPANSIIVSGSLDKSLKFWNFSGSNLLKKLECEYSVHLIFSQQSSNMFGVALSNFEVWVCDYSTFGIVRKLHGCSHPIKTASFSPDCKWITAATIDGCVRTWDIPTSNLVDVFRIGNTMVTSLAYSPSGEFLATTLNGELGIVLWMNKTVYQHISLLPIPFDFEPGFSDYPASCTIVPGGSEDEEISPDEDFACLQDMLHKLTVLSTVNKSRWKHLLKLSDILERNKPKTSTRLGMVPYMFTSSFSAPETNPLNGIAVVDAENPNSASRILKLMELCMTPFVKKLSSDSHESSHYEDLIGMLKEMGPSKVDAEIRSLGPDGGGSVELLQKFIEFINHIVRNNGHFEAAQAYLGVFLKVYSEVLPAHQVLVSALNELHPSLEIIESRMSKRILNICALADYVKSELL